MAESRIPVTFIDARLGEEGIKVQAKLGATLLEVARDNDIELGNRLPACDAGIVSLSLSSLFNHAP